MTKVKIIVPVLLVAIGAAAAYQFMFAKAEEPHKAKVEGEVYVLPREFLVNLVNLADSRFAKVNVALVFGHGYSAMMAAEHAAKEAGAKEGGAKPVEGFGVLPQGPVVRDIITDSLTSSRVTSLRRSAARDRLKKRIKRRLEKETDIEVEDVLFTDIAVQ